MTWFYQNVSDPPPKHVVSITGLGSMTQESCLCSTEGLSLTRCQGIMSSDLPISMFPVY